MSSGSTGSTGVPGLPKELIWALIGVVFISLFLIPFLPGEFQVVILIGIITVVGLGLCFVCFRMQLAVRWVVAALAMVSVMLAVSIMFPSTSSAFYGAGAGVLNLFTDPEQREFWPDIERSLDRHYGPGGIVVTEFNGEFQSFNIAAERDQAISALQAEQGAQALNFLAYIPFALGIVIAASNVALRLLRGAGAPAPSADDAPQAAPAPVRFGRADRVGLLLASIGLVLAFGGPMTELILDEVVLEDGLNYSRGGGINAEYAHLFWPIMLLDKLSYIGGVMLVSGIVVLLSRRVVNRWGWGAVRYEGLDMAWVNWLGLALTLGSIGLFADRHGLLDFLVTTLREFVIAFTGDFMFWIDYNAYPGWLQALYEIQPSLSVIVALGIVIIVSGFLRARSGGPSMLLAIVGWLVLLGGIIWSAFELILALFGAEGNVIGPIGPIAVIAGGILLGGVPFIGPAIVVSLAGSLERIPVIGPAIVFLALGLAMVPLEPR